MKIICNRGGVSTTSAFVLLALAASLSPAAAAEPTQMTGCLTPFGTLTNLAPGDAPARACGPKGQLVHLQLSAPLGKTAKRVFVTSQTFTGNLGGVAGAHAKCQAAADAAGLGGTWRAWIADDTISPATDPAFTKNDGPYVRLDGVMVAANWGDLTDSSLLAALNLNENGQYENDESGGDGDPPYVATGTDFKGASSAECEGNTGSCNCLSWTYDGPRGVHPDDRQAFIGILDSLDGWYGGALAFCDKYYLHIYCFEQ